MSTVEEKTENPEITEADVAVEVQTAIGDTPAAAETVAVNAVKWFDVVEVDEVGFRAFCRLPNDFQHKDIREKAMAAKARRIRQLNHPETDANVILEAEIETVLASSDAKSLLVGELLASRFWRDRDEAVADVQERDEFESIRQDQERWRDLNGKDPDDRPADEWKELTEHLGSYIEAVDTRLTEVQQPYREALEALDVGVLADRIRERRIDAEARRAFKETYDFWLVYVGTLKIPEGFNPEEITQDTLPRERVFTSETDLHDADPAVISRLQDAFERLEGGLASLTAGNS